MAYLGTPSATKAIIDKYGFTFRKKFGQNFLIDKSILENITGAADITKEDTVLEIGPGIGSMTQYLCEAAGSVVAAEIDNELIPILNETLSEYDNVTVINEDALKLDLKELSNGKKLKVVANLPYYITTPIVSSLLENHEGIESITVMVQKEVATRMQAGPGSKDYGTLSLYVQYYSKAEYMFTVPPTCFMPRPGVDSAVIRLDIYDEPPIKVSDDKYMFKVIAAAFNQRRKTLANALGNAGICAKSKDEIRECLCELGFDENIRGEALTLEDFARLSEKIR